MSAVSELRPRSGSFSGEFNLEDLCRILSNKRSTRKEWAQAAEYIELNPTLAEGELRAQKRYEQALCQLKLTQGSSATRAFALLLSFLPQVDNIGRDKMEEIYFAGASYLNSDQELCTGEEYSERTVLFSKAVPDTVFIQNELSERSSSCCNCLLI